MLNDIVPGNFCQFPITSELPNKSSPANLVHSGTQDAERTQFTILDDFGWSIKYIMYLAGEYSFSEGI